MAEGILVQDPLNGVDERKIYKPSLILLVVGGVIFVAMMGSAWFVEDYPWLLVMPLVGGFLLWGIFVLDFTRQRIPFFQAMQDANNLHPAWRLALLAAGAAYGLLLGVFKGN